MFKTNRIFRSNSSNFIKFGHVKKIYASVNASDFIDPYLNKTLRMTAVALVWENEVHSQLTSALFLLVLSPRS